MSTTAMTAQEELESVVPALASRAQSLVVCNQATYDEAAKIILELLTPREKEIDNVLGKAKEEAFELYKKASARYNEFMNPVVDAKKVLKQKCAAWEQEQKRIQEQEQRRLDEEARRLEQEQRATLAVQAEEAGASKKEVNAILDAPPVVTAVQAAPVFQKATGLRTREIWSASVTNKVALVKHVAKNPALIHLVDANMSTLNAMARAQKQLLNIPGVEAKKSMA